MKNLILIFVFLSFVSCKSQKETFKFSEEHYEILEVFLSQQNTFSFLDRHFFNKNDIIQFCGDYRKSKKIFSKADSICKYSKEIEKRKFYCPLADSFKIYDGLLSQKDLIFMQEKYRLKKEKKTVEIDSLIETIGLSAHSTNYYKEINYEDYRSFTELEEYPSIQLNNIYFNEDRNVVVISYSIVSEGIKPISSRFYLLEKRDNLWWKPLGNLKL